MKKAGVFLISFLVGFIMLATMTYASEAYVYSFTLDEEDFNGLDINNLVTPVHVRIHQENYILVTFEIFEEIERGNRPQLEFDSETGVIYLTQELYEGSLYSSWNNSGRILNWNWRQVNIRHSHNIHYNNQLIFTNGQFVDGINFNEIEDITLFDIGLITVHVPKDFVMDTLYFDAPSGTIKTFGDNSIVVKDIFATTRNGDVILTDTHLHNVDLTATNGFLILDGVIVDGNISMSARNGDVIISNSQILSNFYSSIDNGDIILSNSTFAYNISSQATSGFIIWRDITVKQNATATVTSGDIIIIDSRIDGRLTATATTGWINITRVDTDMDRANVRATNRGGSVKIN